MQDMTAPAPDGSPQLIAPRDLLAFHDSHSTPLPHPMTAIEAWDRVMTRPLPGLALAFRVRDAISARFGVQRIGGFSGRRSAEVRVGDRLDFFLVEAIGPEHLTLTARDRHLDVMTSVTTGNGRLGITSSVITHNWFGRVYMWPVGPAHKVIVRQMLRRFAA